MMDQDMCGLRDALEYERRREMKREKDQARWSKVTSVAGVVYAVLAGVVSLACAYHLAHLALAVVGRFAS